MKTDPSFECVAALILAGVVLAFTQPAGAAAKKTRTKERSGTYDASILA